MIVESKSTRRGFVAAAAAVAGVAAIAATRRVATMYGVTGADGTITWINVQPTAPAVTLGSEDAWRAAIGSTVRIAGEQGAVEGRILAVERGASGGPRPANARPEALFVSFETAADRAPVGDLIYGIETVVPGVNELFLSRGADVLGRATLLAVLN